MPLSDLSTLTVGNPWDGLVRFFWGPVQRQLGDPDPVKRVRTHLLHSLAHRRRDAQSIVAGRAFASFDVAGERYDQFDLSSADNRAQLRSRTVSVLAGWHHRCWSLVSRHAEQIRRAVRPGDRYYATAEAYLSELRREFDHLAGVLIRQDDYRSWSDGEYFFDSERYVTFLRAYAADRSEERVGFLIASDETQPRGLFHDDAFRFGTGEAVGPNHYLENFVELSLCDTVLTPPSTFSGMAAFIGDVPIVPLYDGVLDSGFESVSSDLADCVNHPVLGEAIN